MKYTERDRYSTDQRFQIVLDNGESPSKWSDMYDTVSNVSSGTEHITGAMSVSFDKVSGSSASAYIIRPLDKRNGFELDSFSSEGQILSSVYLSDISDVDSVNVALLMSSGTDNGTFYNVADTELSTGWNHIKIDCNNYSSQTGCGVDWNHVKWLAFGVTFDNASDTLADILVDSVRVQLPTAVFNFDPNIDNVTMQAEVQLKSGDGPDEISVDAANTARTTATNVIPVQHVDSEGKVLRSGADSDSPIFTQGVGGSSGGGGGAAVYLSPTDFTATYSTASGILLSGLSFTPSTEQFIVVDKFGSDGISEAFTPSTNGFDYDSGTGVLNLGGSPGFVAADVGYRVQLYGPDKFYSSATDSSRTTVLNPDSQTYVNEVIADVTNEADASTSYYVNCDGYRTVMVQYEFTGGTDTLALSVHGTLQSDGTAAASCLYQNITANGMDNLVHTTASGYYVIDTILKTQEGSAWKYLKLNVDRLSGSADDGDYKIWTKKFY